MTDRVLGAVGYGFLTVQALLVAHGLLTPANHFVWGPHTTQIRLEMRVGIDGASLSRTEAARRCGLDSWEAHAIENVFQLIEQYERTHGADESATITLRYLRNRGDWWVWRFAD